MFGTDYLGDQDLHRSTMIILDHKEMGYGGKKDRAFQKVSYQL
jgi:hypothetical protein